MNGSTITVFNNLRHRIDKNILKKGKLINNKKVIWFIFLVFKIFF